MILRFEPPDGNRHARSLRDRRRPFLSFCAPEIDRNTSGIQNASFGVALLKEEAITDALYGSSVFCIGGPMENRIV